MTTATAIDPRAESDFYFAVVSLLGRALNHGEGKIVREAARAGADARAVAEQLRRERAR